MNVCENQSQKYPLNQIYFYLTKGCNLRCRHCWIATQYQSPDQSYPSLDLDLFQSIIQQAKPLGLTSVKLTGGEPLLHPYIFEILEFIRSEELGLTMETNGTLCTPELAKEIAKSKNCNVSVSLDGADAETHEWVRGVKGSFESAIEGIRNLVRAGLKPQIIMTVMKHNQEHMEPLIRLVESLRAGSIKFNLVQPVAKGNHLHTMNETLSIEELINLGQYVETTLSTLTDLPLDHPPAFRALGKLFGSEGKGLSVCGILNILGVLADGSYALCGIGETIPELVFGHAAKDHLADIWKKTPLLNELREGLPEKVEGICSNCLMKKVCMGNCIALNYYSTRNLWAPFWYCEKAKEIGLFPEIRLCPISL